MAARRIGIDTGGTFTDVAALHRGSLRVTKVPSTPGSPGDAVLAGLAAARPGPDTEVDIVHGTTVGLNAVLTGQLARTAFVTDAGFVDLIEIGRQERRDVYDLRAEKAAVPVPRDLRFEVETRAPDGTSRRPRPAELRALRERLARKRVEAIAIGLLHSYEDPGEEHRVAAALRALGVPITCSADLLPVAGEYERFVAAILNASIQPLVGAYLGALAPGVRPGTLRLMRSSAGIMPAEEAHRFPARAMFSGPAGGVLATRALARCAGWDAAAALDMGGTSTDVCLVRQEAAIGEGGIAGLPLRIPSVEVHTVGCGGGSLAYVDAGGALRVGPQSAGADPGPACYGKGDAATVTDAHVALGHLGADTLLGGGFPIDPDRSVRAIEALARQLGIRPVQAARGILEIAEVHMMRALLVITVQRAVDPASLPLCAYGGAGGLHAEGLRRLLDMPAALVPGDPGAFSAVGLALAGESAEHMVPVLRPLHDIDKAELRRLVGDAADRARAALDGTGRVRTQVHGALRYAGQGSTLLVPLDRGLRTSPDAAAATAHAERYGFVPHGRELELVGIHARAESPMAHLPVLGGRGPDPAPCGERRAPLGGAMWTIYRRPDLNPGGSIRGPCIVEELTGATVVPAGSACAIEPFGLVLTSPGG